MKRSAVVATLAGAIASAQASLLAAWPSDHRSWTLFVLAVLGGAVAGYGGKVANAAADRAVRSRQAPPDA